MANLPSGWFEGVYEGIPTAFDPATGDMRSLVDSRGNPIDPFKDTTTTTTGGAGGGGTTTTGTSQVGGNQSDAISAGGKIISTDPHSGNVVVQMPDGSVRVFNPSGANIGAGNAGGNLPVGVPATTTTKAPASTTTSPISGMTNLEYDSYMQYAKNALQQLGVLDYTPTDSEIASFFRSGFDAEGIANYYMTDPTFVARQPGLPYGLSRDAYNQRIQQLQGQWKSAFGGAAAPTPPKPGAPLNEINSNLFGYALKQNIDPTTFGQNIERFRQTTGKAPSSVQDYTDFTTQQAQSVQRSATIGSTAPRSAVQRDAPRPAIR